MKRRHALVVCTANVCRSPVAEGLLDRALADRVDLDGCTWVVGSAGVATVRAPLDANTVAAAAAAGLELAEHRARQLTPSVLATDGADLVLVMTRAQLREVIAVDAEAWGRTFTLKELVRRTATTSPPTSEEGFDGWLRRVAADRRAVDLMSPDPLDDVTDPYGLPRPAHVAMVDELAREVERLVSQGPWPCRSEAAASPTPPPRPDGRA